MHHHAQLIFIFLLEMGFHHDGQAGLELLTSGDPPISASHSARITGVSHRARPPTGFNIWWSDFFVVVVKSTLTNNCCYGKVYLLFGLREIYNEIQRFHVSF